jgi:hypothetical protein
MSSEACERDHQNGVRLAQLAPRMRNQPLALATPAAMSAATVTGPAGRSSPVPTARSRTATSGLVSAGLLGSVTSGGVLLGGGGAALPVVDVVESGGRPPVDWSVVGVDDVGPPSVAAVVVVGGDVLAVDPVDCVVP